MILSTIPNQRASNAKARIYNAAIRLFAENGGNGVNVSELAEAAGIARGTIYNNIDTPEDLFNEVVGAVSREMLLRTEATMSDISNPIESISTGLRLFARRAHEEHDWGRFLVRFTLDNSDLHDLMLGPPAADIRRAVKLGHFDVSEAQIPTLVTMLVGSTMAAMNAVVRGDQTWRAGGSSAAELFLRAGGVAADEARRISTIELALLAAPMANSTQNDKRGIQ